MAVTVDTLERERERERERVTIIKTVKKLQKM